MTRKKYTDLTFQPTKLNQLTSDVKPQWASVLIYFNHLSQFPTIVHYIAFYELYTKATNRHSPLTIVNWTLTLLMGFLQFC